MIRHRVFVAALAVLTASLPSFAARAVADSCNGVVCAGAASADITPPVTTPMWGYTARQGVLFSAGGFQSKMESAGAKLAAGEPAAAAASAASVADERYVRDKTRGDVEGYGKEFVASRGIHLRLQANAFVIRGANGGKVAVVQTDLGGIPGEVHRAVAGRLAARQTGIEESHLLIGATHTHQGPGGIFQYQGYALLGGDEFDPRVFQAVVAGITNAIVRADARLEPAKIGVTSVATPEANRNRRVSPQWCKNPESLCGPNQQPTGSSPPTADHDTTVFRIDSVGGVPLGVITNFAAHGTIGGDGNLLFSGDNQGWATRLITKGIAEASGPLPEGHEIVDALVNGAQGDVSPIGAGFNDYSAMENAGARQAAAVLSAWQSLGSSLRDDVDVDARFEYLCFCGQRIDEEFVYDGPAIDQSDPMWAHVAPYASLGAAGVTLDDGMALPAPTPAQGTKVPAAAGALLVPSIVRLQVLRIGSVLLATVPGEPTTTVGRRVAARLRAIPNAPWSTVLIAGLADDYVSYFTTPEEYTAAQYEGSFTLFGPQSSPLLEQELTRLARAMAAGEPVPPCDPATDVADCVEHLTHPDTSATSIQPLAPDAPANAAVLSPPAPAVARSTTAEITWRGGGPTVEWAPDRDRVVVERLVGAEWVRVAGDARDAATLLLYDKVDGEHHWTARYDVPVDAPLGRYRFRVSGVGWVLPPAPDVPYELTGAFDVTGGVVGVRAVSGSANWVVRAAYPADPSQDFRVRPPLVGAATLRIVRGGAPTTLTAPMVDGLATFAFQAGDTLDSADAADLFGNGGSCAAAGCTP